MLRIWDTAGLGPISVESDPNGSDPYIPVITVHVDWDDNNVLIFFTQKVM